MCVLCWVRIGISERKEEGETEDEGETREEDEGEGVTDVCVFCCVVSVSIVDVFICLCCLLVL